MSNLTVEEIVQNSLSSITDLRTSQLIDFTSSILTSLIIITFESLFGLFVTEGAKFILNQLKNLVFNESESNNVQAPVILIDEAHFQYSSPFKNADDFYDAKPIYKYFGQFKKTSDNQNVRWE